MHLSPCNAIQELPADVFGFTLSPNPSQGIFTIQITGLQNQEATLSITGIQGKTILQESINGTRTLTKKLDLSNYPKGVYFVKLQSAGQVKTEKMVIQ